METPDMINTTVNWESQESDVVINPYVYDADPNATLNALLSLPKLQAHVWLLTSGTTAASGTRKWVALSKEALLCSATAVNRHLGANKDDIWFNVLPTFHVGG